MTVREAEDLPSPEEAFAALKLLAGAFFQSSPRLPEQTAADEDEAICPHPATVLVDDNGIIKGVDRYAAQLLGHEAQEVVGSFATMLFGKLPVHAEPVLCRIRRQDGCESSVWVTKSDLTLAQDRYVVLSLGEHDPVGNLRTELRYRHLVEQIPAVVFTAGLDGGLFDIYVSPQIESLLGYPQTQWVADPVLWYERLHPDDRRKLDEEFARGCATGGPFRADCRFLTRDDRVVWVHGEARLIKDASGMPVLVQGVATDITETKYAEELVRASLQEKETLLREIHHRVKNNLQITSSLLRLQARVIDDASAKRALQDGQDRIRSMALVHELLYRSKDLSRVDLGEYIQDLTRQLLRSHGVSHVRIERKLVRIPLPIDVAVPCGLILNELVSNALKHAFPQGRAGTISIELQRTEQFDELIVRDDGVGMPEEIGARPGKTLGLSLIRTLANQIDGELTLRTERGTVVCLQIPRDREAR